MWIRVLQLLVLKFGPTCVVRWAHDLYKFILKQKQKQKKTKKKMYFIILVRFILVVITSVCRFA